MAMWVFAAANGNSYGPYNASPQGGASFEIDTGSTAQTTIAISLTNDGNTVTLCAQDYYAQMTHQYVPPKFELYEFDGGSLPPGQPERRTFHSWNGLIGEPAEEVSLAWWAEPAAAFVSTSGRPNEARWARLSAAHLALAGETLRIPARPGTTEEVAQEIRRIAASAELWAPGPALVPGGSPADVAVRRVLPCIQPR